MKRESKSKRQNVTERRDKVAKMIKFKSEIEIAEILGWSRATIVRDVRFLKQKTQQWLDELANDGFLFENKNLLEKMKERGARLEELYGKTDDVKQKISIIREQDRNDKQYLELISETPTIHAFRRIVRQANVQTT